MLQIQAKENKCIDLGRRGEDSAREILFDISGWAELYGQGEAQLIAKRDRDLYSYPASITQNDTTVSWVIKPVDNDQPGYGQCELVYITDGSVVKSIIYQTHTDASLSDPISPPASPSTYGILVKEIGDLDKLNTKDKSNLVSAINELVANSGGIVDDATIVNLVKQYLADNPITAKDIDAIPTPTTAEVGQTIIVKSVNEKGVPTEWEVVDFPSVEGLATEEYVDEAIANIDFPTGGGEKPTSSKWKFINEISVSETVESVTIDADSDGNAISTKHLLVYMYLPKYELDGVTDTGYSIYAVNGKNISTGNGYCYPSSGWDNAHFLFDIMACGDLVYVRCYKQDNGGNLMNGMGVKVFHFAINENKGLYEAITSFRWSLFNRKVLAGSTFKVYGEVL